VVGGVDGAIYASGRTVYSMDRRSARMVSSGRAALLASVAVALSSILASVLTIGFATSPALIADVVPLAIRRTAEFVGALVGLALLLAGVELRRGF
jgi:hypothetical protein